MRKQLKLISSLFILTAVLVLPYFVFAQTPTAERSMLQGLTLVAENGGYATTGENNDLMSVVGLIIQAVLSLLGAIFIIIMIIAGYGWMTASGNEQKVEKALSTIKRAIIGLVITLSSWAIWTFILQKLILSPPSI